MKIFKGRVEMIWLKTKLNCSMSQLHPIKTSRAFRFLWVVELICSRRPATQNKWPNYQRKVPTTVKSTFWKHNWKAIKVICPSKRTIVSKKPLINFQAKTLLTLCLIIKIRNQFLFETKIILGRIWLIIRLQSPSWTKLIMRRPRRRLTVWWTSKMKTNWCRTRRTKSNSSKEKWMKSKKMS